MQKKILNALSILAVFAASFASIACFPFAFYQPKAPKSLIKAD